MFPASFPFYKLERDLQAYINPLVFYFLVMGTEYKLLSVCNFDSFYECKNIKYRLFFFIENLQQFKR